jgi:hypothetical protein
MNARTRSGTLRPEIGSSPPQALRQRIAEIGTEINAASLKAHRIEHAIASRKITLARLQAQLAIHGEAGAALTNHE